MKKLFQPRELGMSKFRAAVRDYHQTFVNGEHDDLLFASVLAHRLLFKEKMVWYKRIWYWLWWRRKLPLIYLRRWFGL